MTITSLSGLLIGTLTIAAVHALIPSHWLMFALVGRVQRWSARQTLTVAAMAGSGHIVVTILLGLTFTAAGKAFWERVHIPAAIEHAATSILLIGLGLYFALSARKQHGGCAHPHAHDYGLTEPPEDASAPRKEKLAQFGQSPTIFGALLLGLTLSPCLDLLAVYVGAAQFPWAALLVASVLMAVTTLGIMLTLVWLTVQGLERWNLRWLERNEGYVIGGILVVMGILLFRL